MISPTGSRRNKSNTWTQAARHKTQGLGLVSRVLSPCGGLTLIEVLISVILLASGTVLVMQSFATGWEVVVRADDRSAAYLFAMSKLADVELANQLGHSLTDRVDGNFRAGAKPFTWHLDVTTDEKDAEAPRLVTLSVNWPRGRAKDEAQFSLLLPGPVQEKKKGV